MSKEDMQTDKMTRDSSNKTGLIIGGVVALLIVGASGFAGGNWYARQHLKEQFGGPGAAGGRNGAMMMGRGAGVNGTNGGPGNRPGNLGQDRGGTMGEVTALDDKSITVKMPDGSSKLILISDTTTYETTTQVDKSGLKTGVMVRVMGNTNSDGSMTGTNVMLNPVMPPQMVREPQDK